jgi:hypothetical protein
MKVRQKYLITYLVMLTATALLWFGKVSDDVWFKMILGCLGAVLIGFSVKTALEIIRTWKGQ